MLRLETETVATLVYVAAFPDVRPDEDVASVELNARRAFVAPTDVLYGMSPMYQNYFCPQDEGPLAV